MNIRTWRPFILLGLCMVLTFLSITPGTSAAEPYSMPVESEEARKLLQDSLSIVEIDREIGRIEIQQTKLRTLQRSLERDITRLEKDIHVRREQAGAVLREYYMGERKTLFTLLLSASSMSSFFRIMEFYDLIIQNDRQVLQAYDNEYRALAKAKNDALRNASQLEEVRNRLILQRERVLALEEQVSSGVLASGNPEAMSRLIQEFTLYWENVGLYEVKKHFQALADAMNNLPDFIQNGDSMLKTNGRQYSINLHEDELNRFLRSQNELFNTFAFRFNDGKVIAEGENGNLSLRIEGHYSIVNDPDNAILFQVDKLVFNQLELPDTTRLELQEEFDMNFYPKQLVSFLKATKVSSTDQRLLVTLELDLKNK
ncbi:hypothetical protein [Paenibacillus lemnae]|uniref:N-terminal domain of peptidoglycan hydrolase CwlO-containing protein n=1 Tax=Paenibacillus lemnae TaxID=1330551 RepID=A0A848M1J6_PAELE|nr:hypothetical protein [Paenibacillus lemnae]NMO94798.1 hypothetical protein [Paenibacillus lemnae]